MMVDMKKKRHVTFESSMIYFFVLLFCRHSEPPRRDIQTTDSCCDAVGESK